MPSDQDRFSDRYGLKPSQVEITIRFEAPPVVREAFVQVAYDVGLGPEKLRILVCNELLVRPDPSNWSEYPNIDSEVNSLVANCDWFQVYDLIERTYRILLGDERLAGLYADPEAADSFADRLNTHFEAKGVGWRLEDGMLVSRGDEAFETALNEAKVKLDSTGRSTALNEVHLALQDLSRRPNPDLTGAVQHIGAALDCVARDLVGDPNSTFGKIVKKHPHLLPKPLDEAAGEIWGFLSENGRHVREGNTPDRDTVELTVGLGANLISFLTKK